MSWPLLLERLVPQASTYARQLDWLFEGIFWVVGFWFVLTVLMFFWLIFRFRKREGVAAEYYDGSEWKLKRWVTIPHLLVLVCDIFIIVGAVKVWYEIKQFLPPAQQTVRVISQQWAWTFVHPGADGQIDTADDIASVDELHVQMGTTYHFKLESRDVLHSFSIPVFRLKQDAVPGRVITGWFEPTKTGTYDLQCTEICGIGHGLMGAKIVIETPEAHAAWVAQHSQVAIAATTGARGSEK
ncbi:MAG TPA: cytochrome c oxidase subunit II [Myxococcota bacterium]|nr:cytochrome c oxidase subunit II [Myxococcota bacterium]